MIRQLRADLRLQISDCRSQIADCSWLDAGCWILDAGQVHRGARYEGQGFSIVIARSEATWRSVVWDCHALQARNDNTSRHCSLFSAAFSLYASRLTTYGYNAMNSKNLINAINAIG